MTLKVSELLCISDLDAVKEILSKKNSPYYIIPIGKEYTLWYKNKRAFFDEKGNLTKIETIGENK